MLIFYTVSWGEQLMIETIFLIKQNNLNMKVHYN